MNERKDANRMKKKILICVAVIMLLLAVTVTVFAASGYIMTYLPGTTDMVTNLPDADTGTGGEAYIVSSQIPQREGYKFLYWTLDYGVAYKVTYVVNPDPIYGTPDDSTVPNDPTQYPPGDKVVVKDQLTADVDYAYNAKGEKILGKWTFTPWDKDDFQIYEDTTITGGWTFKPAPPPVKYHYTVHYLLWDDYLKGKITNVADDETKYIDKLGITVKKPAKTGNDLKPKYRKNYQPVPGYESVTVTIDRDGYEIWIFYQKKSSSS